MKYLIRNTNKAVLASSITDYVIDKNEIEIHFGNYRSLRLPYTKELEKEILNEMKKAAIKTFDQEESYIKISSNNLLNALAQGTLASANAYFLFYNLNNNIKYINILAVLLCGTNTVVSAISHSKAKKMLEEIEKHKCFIYWEEAINDEIIRRYHDMYGENAPIEEANIMTINDLDNYSLKEIKEMAEHISKTEEYRLSLAAK